MSNKQELWVPGIDLTDEYPTPSVDELAELWAAYTGSTNVLPVDGVYGAFKEPVMPVKAIASIDVCDVLRETSMAFDLAAGVETPTRRHMYANGTWMESMDNQDPETRKYQDNIYVNVLRVLMETGQVPPVEQSSEITAILHDWQSRGIYRAANTSTLAGCEPGTIKHNFGRDYPGCFDAVLFPRGYDGAGLMTKAGALALMAHDIEIDLADTPVVHIDDANHHIQAFDDQRDVYPLLNLVLPVHGSNTHTHGQYHVADPLQAFTQADTYFKEQGI